jgi:hypothetical protein
MPKPICIFLAFLCVQAYAQDTVTVPHDGSGGIFTSCYGVIFDDGGEGNYTDTSDGYITLAPGWSTSVSVYFEEFDLEPAFDFVRIYDGPGIGFPLIGEYSGTQLQGQTVTATGPYMTIRQKTDDVMTYSGFKAIWTCVLGNDEPEQPGFSLYPNPATDVLNLQSEDLHEQVTVEIADALGHIRLVEKLSFPSAKISLSVLPPGVYFVTLVRPDKQPFPSRKVIKL